jgi:hypothetical protein
VLSIALTIADWQDRLGLVALENVKKRGLIFCTSGIYTRLQLFTATCGW